MGKITTVAQAEKALAPARQSAAEWLDVVKSFEITDNESYETAVGALKEIKSAAKEVESQRKEWVGPLNTVVKSINAKAKETTGPLGQAEILLKGKLVDWTNYQAAERQRLLADASVAARAGETEVASDIIDEATEAIAPEVAGLQIRERWSGEVVDESLIPREYLVVDEKRLLKMTRELKGEMNVPGWRAFPDNSVAVRS